MGGVRAARLGRPRRAWARRNRPNLSSNPVLSIMLRVRKGGCPWCSPPVAAATTGKARPRAAHLAAREWREREPQRLIRTRSEEHTSELQSLMRISYAVFCLKKKNLLTEHI